MIDSPNEFGAWTAAYEEAWRDPRSLASQVCPSSGGETLHLVFLVNDIDAESGTAVFWCDACLRGLMPTRAPIPIGATKVLRGLEEVPNYTLVIDDS